MQQRQALALRQIVTRHGQVFVALGGVTQGPSIINPWSLEERQTMLGLVLGDAAAAVAVLPVADCWYDDRRWAQSVRAAVASEAERRGLAQRNVFLYGLERGGAAAYRRLFPDWEVRDIAAPALIPNLHERLLDVPPQAAFDSVPSALREWLAASLADALRSELREELHYVVAYRESWNAAPYTPIFVTVDALVTHRAHVLVVVRAQRPGRGLLALPGGFIDADEFLADSALRELREETGLELSATDCSGVRVYDHPRRSLRGRIVTHLHRYELPVATPVPPVRGGDDAARAYWLPYAAARPDRFFEDHYAMLQVELGLP